METTIKHAEEERSKAMDSARNLYEETQMLKEEVDAVRSNIGLERLPDSEADNKIVQKYVNKILACECSHNLCLLLICV